MASIYKRKDRETWVCEWTEDGKLHRKTAGKTRKVALQVKAQVERRLELKRYGVIDDVIEQSAKPLEEHLDDYQQHLIAGERAETHWKQTIYRIRRVLDGCKFLYATDIKPLVVEKWLKAQRDLVDTRFVSGVAQTRKGIASAFEVSRHTVLNWRRAGAPIESRPYDLAAVSAWVRENRSPALSEQTSNYYLTAINAFLNWMVAYERLRKNPLSVVKPLTITRDEKRVLTPEAFDLFLEAAWNGEPFRGLSGRLRYALYVVAANTGLRRSELRSLIAESFDLQEDQTPSVLVRSSDAKNSNTRILPLRNDVVEVIRPVLASCFPGSSVWPGSWPGRSADMVRRDLEAAQIPQLDEFDRPWLFHELRHQFATRLAGAGIHPQIAQQLLDHSSVDLTMNVYTHTGLAERALAVNTMPSFARPDLR